MTPKNRGGRGHRSENPYERFTVTLPPGLKEQLDTLAASRELSRSEALSLILGEYFTGMTSKETAHTTKQQQVAPAKRKQGQDGKKTGMTSSGILPGVVQVQTKTVPRGLKWKPEKYQTAEDLLSHGEKITRIPDSADYRTERGEVMSWRTVEALLKLRVLI